MQANKFRINPQLIFFFNQKIILIEIEVDSELGWIYWRWGEESEDKSQLVLFAWLNNFTTSHKFPLYLLAHRKTMWLLKIKFENNLGFSCAKLRTASLFLVNLRLSRCTLILISKSEIVQVKRCKSSNASQIVQVK